MPLDAESLRRPDFTPGREIAIADGQKWTFPLPVIELVPDDNDAGFAIAASAGEGDEYGRLYNRWYESEDLIESIGSILGMARLLLRRNYRLSTEDLAQVLRFSLCEWDEDGKAMFNAVRDVCTGRGPKPSAAGDE